MNKKTLTISLLILTLVLGGFYFWNNKYDQQIVNQEQEEIIDNEIDISDWETFRDEELGIEFKYPDSLKVTFDANQRSVYISAGLPWPQRGSSLVIQITDRTLNQFIDDYNNSDVLSDGTVLAKIFEQQDYNLNGLNATLLKGSTAIGINKGIIFIVDGDQNYTIEFMDELTVEELRIVESFKFNQVYSLDTIDWKIYRNEELGIEFKYPGDWELEDNQNYEFHSIYLSSPETKKLVENKQIPYFYDIAIVYYPSILDEEENINSNNVEDLIAKNRLLTKIGNIKIGNKDAVDAVWGGHGSSYVILAMEDLQLYKVVLPRISDRNDLNSTEKTIINSFIFY